MDLGIIADELYLYVQEVPLDGIDGCIVHNEDVGVILINSLVEHEYRRRFTLAHEIGHFMLPAHIC